MEDASDILFETFADLIFKLGHPPRSNRSRADGRYVPVPPEKIFQSWTNHLPRPLPPHTGKVVFRLLFPHEGARRRYGLKETKLAAELQVALGLFGLDKWDAVGNGKGLGCLGNVVENAMKHRIPLGTKSDLTLRELDNVLDQLAAPSTFSQLSQIPQNPLSPSAIIQGLYRDCNLSAYALSVLTQIILRDLRPLLCPLPRESHPTSMLRCRITAAPEQLGLHAAMWCWDPVMARLYRDGKGCIDWCADTAETVASSPGVVPIKPGPVVGVNVQIPKCRKGRSIADAVNPFFTGSVPVCHAVFAEVKYDGYRMQIHVELCGEVPKITVFSKSKRNATFDRGNTHAIILASLGLSTPRALPQHSVFAERVASSPMPREKICSTVILEAEVVPWNEASREGGRGPGIEEFWWLGPAGVTVSDSAWGSQTRHLCLVYFDILHLDGESLLEQTYAQRRRILEKVTRPISGFCFLASRVSITMTLGRHKAEQELRKAFQNCVRAREEGLVLKVDMSTYNSTKLPWVKLKKDYIPNLGDCIDLVVLGAGWDIDRARELRVDTSVYTTFYIGTITNRDAVSRRCPPHFQILFRVSYGMDRDQLEIYNENIRLERWRGKPYDRDDPWKRRLLGLSWKYSLPKAMVPPSVLFERPLCAEVMGAGFQKLPMSELYELRWPRLVKIFEKNERPWTSALGAAELKAAAHRSLGYGEIYHPPSSPEDDSLRALWRSKSFAAVDIPDLSPSPRKALSPRRRASAPVIIKCSPPNPNMREPEQLSPLAKRSKTGKDLITHPASPPSPPSSPTPRSRQMAPLTSHAPPPALLSLASLRRATEMDSPPAKRPRHADPKRPRPTELPTPPTSSPHVSPAKLKFTAAPVTRKMAKHTPLFPRVRVPPDVTPASEAPPPAMVRARPPAAPTARPRTLSATQVNFTLEDFCLSTSTVLNVTPARSGLPPTPVNPRIMSPCPLSPTFVMPTPVPTAPIKSIPTPTPVTPVTPPAALRSVEKPLSLRSRIRRAKRMSSGF